MRQLRNKVACSLLFLFIIMGSSQYGLSEAGELEEDEQLILTRDKIVELARKNYVEVVQSQLQIRSQAAHLGYLYTQRASVAELVQAPEPSRLPTSMEELQSMIPEYEQLADEEKQQLEPMLVIQSMINTTFNQYIDGQSSRQHTALLLQQEQNLKSLDEQVRESVSNLHAGSLELDKAKRLVQFYAMQSYYELQQLTNDIQYAALEVDYFKLRERDTRQLYKAGLAAQREVEESQTVLYQKQQAVDDLKGQHAFRMNLFKRDLGVEAHITVVMPDLETMSLEQETTNAVVDLNQQYDMKKADWIISQADSNYELAKKDNHNLINYYLAAISIEKENKTIIKRQLEKRLINLDEEGKTIATSLERLLEEKARLTSNRDDYELLHLHGRITGREMEDMKFELSKLHFAIHSAVLSLELWKERKLMAVDGLLV